MSGPLWSSGSLHTDVEVMFCDDSDDGSPSFVTFPGLFKASCLCDLVTWMTISSLKVFHSLVDLLFFSRSFSPVSFRVGNKTKNLLWSAGTKNTDLIYMQKEAAAVKPSIH